MRRDAFLRLLLWFLVIDGLTAISMGFGWTYQYEVMAAGPLIVAMVLRIAIWMYALRRFLAPVRELRRQLEAGERPDDALLLAADHSLQWTPRRFLLVLELGWIVAVPLAALASPVPAVAPGREVAAVLTMIGLILALPTLTVPIFRGVVADTHMQLGLMLHERQLQPARPRVPLAKGLVFIFLTLLMASLIGMLGVAVWQRGDGLEAAAAAEQRRLAELDAQAWRLAGTLGEDAQLVTTAELPPQLQGLEPDAGETLAKVDHDRELVLAATPAGEGRWLLRVGPYEDDSWLFGLGLTLLILVTTIPTLLATVALERGLTKPLSQLESAARQVAEEGKLRGQARVIFLFDDEIGDLAAAFNAMLDVLEELAAAAATVGEGDLRVELERPGDLPDAFRAMVARLDQVVVQIRSTALEVAAAAAEIQAATQEQELAVEQQSASVRQVGASVASLAEAADAISEAAKGVLANAEQTRRTTEETATRIGELSGQAAGVGELLELIREIAERSDLLALNGSLEAVRAGEAGRGFALVAAEMRRLAERVTGTVNDVSGQVSAIQRASSSTVDATRQSRNLAENTAEAARRISTETQRQSGDTEQLKHAVEAVALIADATSEATTHTRSTTEGLRAHADQLELLTRQFKLRSEGEGEDD